MESAKAETIYRQDYKVPSYLINTVHLNFKLHEDFTEVTSTMKISRNRQSDDVSKKLILDGEQLELLSILYNGKQLHESDYTVTETNLQLNVVDDDFELQMVTRIYPDKNSSLEGLYRSSGNYCTQCEAEGFRKITYFNDRPDNLAKFTTRIEAPLETCPVLLSNGNRIDRGELDSGYHFAVWEDPFPKPCYLFALVAGKLLYLEDSYTTCSGRDICLRIYVEERNIDKCEHAMRSLKKAMKWDEDVYGLEYDLDIFMIVAVDDFNMGAMENKGLNIFNSKYILASPKTATDADYLGIEGVVAHEYFHNWTGNRVTCRDWFQLSLKEGLTVFRDQEFSADMNSRPVQRIDDVRVLRTHQFREDSSPMAHPVRPDSYEEINNFYTVTVYNKGAEVIRMMHTLLGPEGFRKGMNIYFERHDGKAVTCDDFVASMSDANKYSLDQFKYWYSQSGTPQLVVSEKFYALTQEYELEVEQTCPETPGQKEKQPFHIPIEIGLLAATGKELSIGDSKSVVLELKKTKEKFLFKGVKEKPVLSFLRNFSAPVKVSSFQDRQELMFLMANDSDLYNRWEASSRLAEQFIFDIVEELQSGKQPALSEEYIEAVAANIETGKKDSSLLAQALQLPPEPYLAGLMETVDPVNLHKARLLVQQQLGEKLKSVFSELYEQNDRDEKYNITPEAMGGRSLKNVSLGYLMSMNPVDETAASYCLSQYEKENNMTDVTAALQNIANSDLSSRNDLLDDFFRKWKHDPLVMDKWLMIQATSRLESTLDEVKKLMNNEVFSIKNPNKVRSLIGAFCSMNHYRFHDIAGEGYSFLADRIIELNGFNPQIAARLVSPFTTWRKYDSERQILMRDQLERIAATPKLSRDVNEIVRKSL